MFWNTYVKLDYVLQHPTPQTTKYKFLIFKSHCFYKWRSNPLNNNHNSTIFKRLHNIIYLKHQHNMFNTLYKRFICQCTNLGATFKLLILLEKLKNGVSKNWMEVGIKRPSCKPFNMKRWSSLRIIFELQKHCMNLRGGAWPLRYVDTQKKNPCSKMLETLVENPHSLTCLRRLKVFFMIVFIKNSCKWHF